MSTRKQRPKDPADRGPWTFQGTVTAPNAWPMTTEATRPGDLAPDDRAPSLSPLASERPESLSVDKIDGYASHAAHCCCAAGCLVTTEPVASAVAGEP